MSIWDKTRELAGLWYQNKKRNLQNARKPQTQVDSGGTKQQYSWQGQDINRDDLRKVKEIRESGGLVCWLFDVKATMRFGTGAELQAEEDALEETLNEDIFTNLDLTVLELGRDATWYPYGIAEFRETRGNGFAHLEFIEPWTILPQTDEYGDILAWEQETQQMNSPDIIQTEDVGYVTLNKSSARDKIGISEVLRNEEEITQYKENQQAVNDALEVAAYPHHVWTVGAEGRTPINDNDLRRVRNLIDNMDGDTQFVVGPDIDHDKITPADFDFESITKRDLRILTTSVGLPMELAGYGREGMGSGSESRLIMDMLALQNEVARRHFEVQFIDQFVRPVIEQYTEFDSNQNINLQINPFLDERENIAELITKVGDYMSTSEVRDRLDLPPIEDDEMSEAYRPPQQIEEAEEGDQQDQGGLDEIFNGDGQNLEEGGTGNLKLVDESTPEFDRHYLEMLEGHAWAENTGRHLVGFSESQVPEMVVERMRETILSGAMFSEFEDVPSSDLMELRQLFADKLTEDGWTTDELTNAIQELEPQLEDYEAERIARSETQHLVNEARESAYEERGLEEAKFKWVGTDDNRNAEFSGVEICRRIAEETQPQLGGEPRTLEGLDELIQEVHDELDVPTAYRQWTPHINCRHTYVRHVE